jgi:hypothetical protein
MAVDLNQLQQVLESAQKADAFKVDVKRALRKVSSLMNNLQAAVEEAETLLSDEYVPVGKERKGRAIRDTGGSEADEQAPYGRKKDGTPKNRPGRTKAA